MSAFLSILSGFLITMMILMNATLSSALGPYTANVVIHGIGLILITLFLLLNRTHLIQKKELPLWLYTGGMIGILTVFFSNYSFFNLGASLTLALGLLGQSLTALVVDHYGFFGAHKHPFHIKKLAGLAIIATGITVMAFS